LRFGRIFIEASGIAEPGEIAAALANDVRLRGRLALTVRVLLVDALQTGLPDAAQVAAVDCLIVTKTALAGPEATGETCRALAQLRQSHVIGAWPDDLLHIVETLRRGGASGDRPVGDGPVFRAGRRHVLPVGRRHADHAVTTASCILARGTSLDRLCFGVDLLAMAVGPRLLRLKALWSDGCRHVALGAAGGTVFPLETLPASAPPPRSYVDLVAERVNAEQVASALQGFLRRTAIASAGRTTLS